MLVKQIKPILIVIGIILFSILYFVLPSFASSATVTQGYGSDYILQKGMIVGLKSDDPRMVIPVNYDNVDTLHGVVVGANDSAVLLGSDTEKVYVASGGRFLVLVSNQNGPIKSGDYVAPSAIDGIGMRAGDGSEVVIGKALEDFDASNQSMVKSVVTVADVSGNEKQLGLGSVIVDISVGNNPLKKSNTSLPEALRRSSEAVAGKQVEPAKVYISLALIIITSALAGSMIYSAVRSSIVALGRNPLGKKDIMKGLFGVITIGLIVLISGFFGVYLILKL